MSIKSEQLLETLLDLERSRQREHDLRIESEALLEGLRNLAGARDTQTLFQNLVRVLHAVIDFEEAFILQAQTDGSLSPIASTSMQMEGTIWPSLSVFKRVLAGRPVATFDVDQVPEWASQSPCIREDIKSALHIGLNAGKVAAILVVTHSEARHFGAAQVKQAKRFSPLASQALLTLDLQRAVTQRDRFFQLSLDLMAIVSADGSFRQFNAAWGRVLGFSHDEIKQKTLFDFAHVDDRAELFATLSQLEDRGEQRFIESRFQCRDGSYRWLSCSLADYPDDRLCYIVARDVTDRVVAEQQLAHDAHHDSLTGLPNRSSFLARLNEALAYVTRQPRYEFAVLYLDLNRFKVINDTLGHDAGDELLKEVARRLLKAVREVDLVARIGGDEFVILLTDVEQPAGAEHVAARVHKLLGIPLSLRGCTTEPSASIGITLSTRGYRDAAAVLRDADSAMYAAKSQGKSQSVVYQDNMTEVEI